MSDHSIKSIIAMAGVLLLVSLACSVPANMGGTPTPQAMCTPPVCAEGETFVCPKGQCPGGCGITCAKPQSPTGTPVIETETPVVETPMIMCTAPACPNGMKVGCPSGDCPGGCGSTCVPQPVEYRGFFVMQNGAFLAYDFGGAPMQISYPVGQSTWVSAGQVQALGEDIYVYDSQAKTVYHYFPQGSASLNWLPQSDNLNFAISPDGASIAYTIEHWGNNGMSSELWMAGLDGSNALQITRLDPTPDGGYYVLKPTRWTPEGTLLYEKAMTGIGGYILFGGHSSLYLYDPLSAATTTLVDIAEENGLCIDDVFPDLSRVIFHCSKQGVVIRVRNLNSGSEVSIPPLAEQGQAGTSKVSPNGKLLAYGVARGQYDQEAGWVQVVYSDLSGTYATVASTEGGYYTVLDWINDNTLLIARYGNDGSMQVWSVNYDGTDLKYLVDGQYVGLVK
jgi:hypothetical protein